MRPLIHFWIKALTTCASASRVFVFFFPERLFVKTKKGLDVIKVSTTIKKTRQPCDGLATWPGCTMPLANVSWARLWPPPRPCVGEGVIVKPFKDRRDKKINMEL